MAESAFSRRSLTFEQAEGGAPLPAQLAKSTVSCVLTARLWSVFHAELVNSSRRIRYNQQNVGDLWKNILRSFYVDKHGDLADRLGEDLEWNIERLRKFFEKNDYLLVLGTTEWLVRRLQQTAIPEIVAAILEEERAAYRLVDRQDIVLLASEYEGEALLSALSALDASGLQGARVHLKAAANALAQGHYADSIRESIHSIESAARTISPSSKFSDALAQIESGGKLHAAFRRGLLALYGYTSDEQGIRHPLLDNGDASVKEEDALLMLGICSAAVTYLVNKR